MLFARSHGGKLGVSDDHTSRHSRVCGYSLVASIASDNPVPRVADHAAHHQDTRLKSKLRGELSQTCGIAIENRAGCNPMNESVTTQRRVRHGGRKGWRDGGDDFWHLDTKRFQFFRNTE